MCAAAALALSVGRLDPVVEAAKPPKVPDVPASTTFRCMAGQPVSAFCGTVSNTTDRIRDDGSIYDYSPVVAKIWSSGFYAFHFEPLSGRRLNLDLGDPIGTVPCEGVNCNPDHSTVVNSHPLTLDTASIELKPLTETGAELPGLLWGMKCTDEAYPAKVHYSFSLPSRDGHWGLNFNNAVYPPSTNAVIRRAIDGVHWTVESYGAGELLSWAHSGLRRPQTGPSHEGVYAVNFSFTITIAGLPSGVTCPQP